jgi:hypothetical protein
MAVRVHDEHRPIRARRHVGGHAVDYAAAELAVAVRADDDQAGLVLIGRVHDCLPGWCSLDCHGRGPEPGRLGQGGTVLGGLLGGVPDIVGAGRVELCVGHWYESDPECSPYGEDDRVAPGGQLLAGLRDRVPGEVRAVISEEHRPPAVGVLADRAPPRMGRD